MRLFIGAASFAVVLAAPALAQTPSVTWQRVIELNGVRGQATDMQIAPNGDMVVAGHIPKPGSGTGKAQNDAWVARFSPDGRKVWSRTLGSPLRDEAVGLAIDSAGAVFITGWRDVQEVRQWSAFAAKYAADGALQWERTIGGSEERIAAGEIALLSDGSILLAGREHVRDEAGSRPVLIRLNPDGNVDWVRRVDGQPDPSVGGGPWVYRNGQPYASDGARITSVVNPDTAIIAFDRISIMRGNFLAGCVVVSLEDGATTDEACPKGVLDGFKAGKSYHGGMSSVPATSDIVVKKFRPDGSIEWQRKPETPFGDGIKAVAETSDGGVLAAGFQLNSSTVEFHNWDALLVRFDAGGNELWRRVFGGSRRDEFDAVAVLPDGSIIVAGATGSQPGPVEFAPWIMRLNSQGELEGEALKELQDRQF